jgi:aspartyl-tRNA synthetase
LDHVGSEATLCGWVDSYRDHGQGLFVDLRDRYGKTQVVFSPESGPRILELASKLRNEYVIRVTGKVAARPEGMSNLKLETGQIELRGAELELLNASETPPFQPSAADLPGEDLRLRYRYLDLRRAPMQRTLQLRHRLVKLMRDYFDEQNFLEIETPILGRSTPEGARDYLVPSRIQGGAFYALPQSPQLYKQILMVAGYDRYIQVARCFRDEDLRADRQPEFTQLDLEMAFVDQDDVIGVIDGLVARVASEMLGIELSLPLPRMTYDEAIERFGHDAPDLRYGMELIDVGDLAAEAEFRVFRETADAGKRVRGINAVGAADAYSRKGIDELTYYVQQDFKAKGLVWFKVDDQRKLNSPVAKNFSEALLARLADRMGAQPGDLLLFVADEMEITSKALHGLRTRIARDQKMFDPSKMHFSWVVEFPMFDVDEETGEWVAMHHPFTAPRVQDQALLDEDPRACRAQAYDLVVNGLEAGGGTVRIHDSKIQQKVFSLLGLDQETARQRFGFLLDALQYGAPPHAGIALGLDRWVMLLGRLDNIRDCIAFPKTQRAADLMTGAPSEVDPRQLRDLSVKIDR